MRRTKVGSFEEKRGTSSGTRSPADKLLVAPMLGRLYGFLFLGLMCYSAWYQYNYMKIYSREFEAENSLKRIGAEVYSASEFRLTRYQSNRVSFSLEGKNASQLNDGYLYLSGDVAYKDFLPSGEHRFSAKSPKILAQLVTVKEGRSLLESSMKVRKATLPDEVKILYEGDALSTKNVLIDMDAGMISTQQSVQVDGPDGTLKATGGTFAFRTGEMKFTGPVKGTLQSSRLKAKSKSTK